MKYITTKAIVLGRLNFGEADRILKILTPDEGKVSCIAKGVRKLSSKLAGGLELLAENDLTLMSGKSELMTVRSARCSEAWSDILADFTRLHHAYDMLQFIDKALDDGQGKDLYDLLKGALEHLNYESVHPDTLLVWFYLQALSRLGHQPNLQQDALGKDLDGERVYSLDFQAGALILASGAVPEGLLEPRHIKLWRLAVVCDITTLVAVGGVEQASTDSLPILQQFIKYIYA